MNVVIVNKVVFLLLMSLMVFGCAHTYEETRDSSELSSIYEKRNKAMNILLKQNQHIVKNLESLDDKEKNSVIALVTLTKAVTMYEGFAVKRDDKLVGKFYKQLSDLSPVYPASGKFQAILNSCFDQSVSCLSARQECRAEEKTDDECDTDPRVIGPCANLSICMMNAFLNLEHGIPDILGGRDPWPPQPFPY